MPNADWCFLVAAVCHGLSAAAAWRLPASRLLAVLFLFASLWSAAVLIAGPCSGSVATELVLRLVPCVLVGILCLEAMEGGLLGWLTGAASLAILATLVFMQAEGVQQGPLGLLVCAVGTAAALSRLRRSSGPVRHLPLAFAAVCGLLVLAVWHPPLFWFLPVGSALCALGLWAGREETRHPGANLILPAATVILILLGGLWAAGLLERQRDRAVRAELALRARLVAEALDPADLAEHHGLRSDLGTPAFVRIKARLQAVRAAHPDLRYAYLMRRIGEQIRFPNDDEEEGSDDPTDPENPYLECPVDLGRAVAEGRDLVCGPYRDRWGEFVTAAAWVPGPGGRPGTMVALDLKAERWRSDLAAVRLAPLLLAGLSAALAVLGHGRLRTHRRALALAREAAAANRAKDVFLAAVTHELRAPLNGVIGMTGLLAGTGLDPEQRELVEGAHSSTRQLLALINGLIDFARIEAGQLVLDVQPFDPRELVEEAVALLADRAQAKGVELAGVVEGEVPARLLGDAVRLRQILFNLLGNAVQFTGQGEIELRVALLAAEAGRARLRLLVRDTGTGISSEVQARLFRPFTGEDEPEAGTRGGGSGLGLALTRRLVEAMQGRIAIASQPGLGTEVQAEVELGICPVPGASPLASVVRGRRILLAVESAITRQAIAAQLQHLDLLAEPAADPASAEAILRSGRCAAALLESGWSMPLLERCAAAAVPAALLATVSAGGTQLLARRNMVVLSRPVRLSALVRALHRLWGLEPEPVAVRRTPPPGDAAMRGAAQVRVGDPTPAPQPVVQTFSHQVLVREGHQSSAVADAARDLVVAFRNSLPATLTELRGALVAGEPGRLRSLARNLRRGAGSIGLVELAELGRRLEEAAPGAARDQLLALMEDLEGACSRAERALSEYHRR